MTEKIHILSLLIMLPIVGAILLALLRHDGFAKVVAAGASLMTLIASVFLFIFFNKKSYSFQFVESYQWLPQWSINLTLGVDGISAPFMLLITVMTFAAILHSWRQVKRSATAYYINILLLEGIMIGLFASTNLIQFFIFWEAMLIPLFLLIGMWGGDRCRQAAFKFLLYTFGGSIFMFVAIIALYFVGGSLDFARLSRVNLSSGLQGLLFWAFVIAFAVKIPIFPFHTWLPDTYSEAPTPVTVILSGILAKMGTYGLLRIAIPIFPEAAQHYSNMLILLSLMTIIYGAYAAIAQTDLKRLIAYSSMSHMGFIALGIFSLNRAGIEGSIMQMINHGVVTGGLFLCAGLLQERTGVLRMDSYGGLALKTPWFVVVFTILALAGSGFPGLNYFIGEFLVLSGAFDASVIVGLASIIGVLLGVTYMCWVYYRLVLNKQGVYIASLKDLSAREAVMFAPLLASVFYLGLHPQAVLGYFHYPTTQIIQRLSGHYQTLTMLMGLPQ